ncbi:hypothetical protein GCM10011509_26110 [Ornithinimicrobium pekingense]|uniref:Uncharacterized protein n=1 Tax=Ornithinimicrobium pekingense TaxID=384677 RepID=A0ABQ2FB26_9MICO|nr:hypothetical protein GCM10011509_26110 [Ornithinimicrobium pekingense]
MTKLPAARRVKVVCMVVPSGTGAGAPARARGGAVPAFTVRRGGIGPAPVRYRAGIAGIDGLVGRVPQARRGRGNVLAY